jgi:hypothetical protein
MSSGYVYRDETQCCPRCGGSAIRIKRRSVDRLVSVLFGTVHRYHCEQFGCSWEGNLKVNPMPRLHEPSVGVLS